jgi:hypothetical protein
MNLFSKVAQSPLTAAFFAHSGVAFFAMFLGSRTDIPLWHCAMAAVVAAAVKEFYIDIHFETDPPQTYADSAGDFVGYLVGIAAAVYLCTWRIVL